MPDDLTAQVRETLLRSAGLWAGDESEKAWAAISVDTLAPRIAACMRAVKESTRLNAWIPEDEAEPLIAAAGLAALRGET